MNPALTSYVLVSETNNAVSLPFHALFSSGEPATIVGFEPPCFSNSSGRVQVREMGGLTSAQYFPHVFNLKLITENEYMAAQAGEPPFYLIDTATGERVSLPHYLPDDHTVTSLDHQMMVAETTRSITWLPPSKYGLSIVAYCDLQVMV